MFQEICIFLMTQRSSNRIALLLLQKVKARKKKASLNRHRQKNHQNLQHKNGGKRNAKRSYYFIVLYQYKTQGYLSVIRRIVQIGKCIRRGNYRKAISCRICIRQFAESICIITKKQPPQQILMLWRLFFLFSVFGRFCKER